MMRAAVMATALPKTAMTVEQLTRLHRRVTRGSGGKALTLQELVVRSMRQTRARVTHPGKR